MKNLITSVIIVIFLVVSIFSCKKPQPTDETQPVTQMPTGGGRPVPKDTTGREYIEDIDIFSMPQLNRKTTSRLHIVPGTPIAGEQSSANCVCWAVGYGMFSTIYGPRETPFPKGNNTFSPAFISNQLAKEEYEHLIPVLQFVKSIGDCKTRYMDNNAPFSSQPTMDALNNAKDYQVYKIYDFRTFDIERMRNALDMDYVIPFTMDIDKGFRLEDANSYDNINTTKMLLKRNWGQKEDEGHSMLICGYDDDLSAFRVLNSWGEGYCDKGYVWVDYDYLKRNIHYLRIKNGNGTNPDMYVCGFKPVPSRAKTYEGRLNYSDWQSFWFTVCPPAFWGDVRFENLEFNFSFDYSGNTGVAFDYASTSTDFDRNKFPKNVTYIRPSKQFLQGRHVSGNHIELFFKDARYVGDITGNIITGKFYQNFSFTNADTKQTQIEIVETPLTLNLKQ